MQIARITSGELTDLQSLLRLYHQVFELPNQKLPADDYLLSLLDKSGIYFLVARIDGVIVGGLTAHALPTIYYRGGELYVYDLAVAADQQRKGIGTALMKRIVEIAREEGMQEVFVQADRPDQPALDFYTKINGIAEDVIHFTYPASFTNPRPTL